MADILAASQQTRTDASLRTLFGISAAHWVSHFHILTLPMLFPFLKAQLGVGYIELGFALTVFAVVSALTQAPLGYVVDHIGARKILLLGLCLGGLALIMLGLHVSYPWLIASAVLLGIANSVYHPADYAILSAHMDEARMGRAFSIHTFAGFLGGAVAPAIVAALVTLSGGQGALIACGAVGPLVALLLVVMGIPEAGANKHRTPGERAPRKNIITPAMPAAGFLGGVIAPSRDMLVRGAAPAGAAGRAFGIVSTGFNFSGIASPLLFGWIMDQNAPHWVFGLSALFMALTVLLALFTDRKPQGLRERSNDKADAILSPIGGG